jgi:hypothetical protein
MVLGESMPSVQDILFGTVPERIAMSTDMPIIIVRKTKPSKLPSRL